MTVLSPRLQAEIDALVLREGGYVNDTNDRGGPTKYGITLATLHAWRGTPVSAADVQALDKGEAAQIFASEYFIKPGLGAITDPLLQEFMFDFAVHSGQKTAVMALQRCIGTTDDGDFGPVSCGKLAAIGNAAALFYAVKCERYELLLRDVGAHPTDARYAGGWSNRLDGFPGMLA